MESRTEQIVKEVRLNLLQEIDRLPREAAEKLQSIIMLHGEYAAFFDEKRNDKIELLIEQDFFEDLTDNKAILEKHYSKDNLFKELSKRQYEFQPNSNTTKKEMVDWILNNSVILTEFWREYETRSQSKTQYRTCRRDFGNRPRNNSRSLLRAEER